MSNSHFGLCELLFVQPPGSVVTADHAYERRLLLQQFDHRQIDLIAEERYDRVQIFVQFRDFMDFSWKVFCKTLPSMSAQQKMLVEQRDFAGLKRLREQEAAAARQEALAEAAAKEDREKILAEENAALRQQLGALRQQIVDVNVRVAQSTDRRSGGVAGGSLSKGPSTKELERMSDYLDSEFLAIHENSQAALQDLEVAERGAIAALREQHRTQVELLTAQRTLVMPHFEAYRPKIPTEHSLQPEEYLKKCLGVQVFERFYTAFGLLQELENESRNAIANEALTFLRDAWSVFFTPIFQRTIAQLHNQVAQLAEEKAKIMTHVEELAVADKITLLRNAETHTRHILEDVRQSDLAMMTSMSHRLETVSALAKRNAELQRLLEQQGQRHKRETAVLIAAIENSNAEPSAHPPMLPLETRVAYSQATVSETPRKNLPLVALARTPRSDSSRSGSQLPSRQGAVVAAPPPLKGTSVRRPWHSILKDDIANPQRSTTAARATVEGEMYFSGYIA